MADLETRRPTIASQAADMVLVAGQIATLARLMRPVLDDLNAASDEGRLFHLNAALDLSYLAEAAAERLAGMAEGVEQDSRSTGGGA